MTKEEETVQLEIKMRLPESVAREAEALGLLEPESLESLIHEELRRRRTDRLFEAADRLGAVPLPSFTDAEVEAEVRTVRSRRRVSQTPAKAAEAWEELFRLGDTLAVSDKQESGTFTAAVLAMRR